MHGAGDPGRQLKAEQAHAVNLRAAARVRLRRRRRSLAEREIAPPHGKGALRLQHRHRALIALGDLGCAGLRAHGRLRLLHHRALLDHRNKPANRRLILGEVLVDLDRVDIAEGHEGKGDQRRIHFRPPAEIIALRRAMPIELIGELAKRALDAGAVLLRQPLAIFGLRELLRELPFRQALEPVVQDIQPPVPGRQLASAPAGRRAAHHRGGKGASLTRLRGGLAVRARNIHPAQHILMHGAHHFHQAIAARGQQFMRRLDADGHHGGKHRHDPGKACQCDQPTHPTLTFVSSRPVSLLRA